jgi:hypothetical protein
MKCSWEAGVNGAKPGIATQAYPNVRRSYRQEYCKGRAEDFARVIDLKDSVEVQRTGRGRPRTICPHGEPGAASWLPVFRGRQDFASQRAWREL